MSISECKRIFINLIYPISIFKFKIKFIFSTVPTFPTLLFYDILNSIYNYSFNIYSDKSSFSGFNFYKFFISFG